MVINNQVKQSLFDNTERTESETTRLAVTVGDPNGIGLEVTVRSLASGELPPDAEIVVLCPPAWLEQMAKRLGVSVESVAVGTLPEERQPGRILCLETTPPAGEIALGIEDPRHFPFVRESLRLGVEHVCHGRADALVTGPIVKKALSDGRKRWPGQTQFVAAHARALRPDCGDWRCPPLPVMAMFGPTVRAVLVTDHLPYTEVPVAITRQRLMDVLRVAHEAGRYLGKERPRIGVCGLNPHAGEGGLLGPEERDLIIPAMESLNHDGAYDLLGPVAGDTIANRALKGEIDLIVAMHHDQGLGPLKAVSFGKAVNVTLGIPMIRTSVDHGTAYDIAPQLTASHTSLIEALKLAASMAARRNAWERRHERT